MTTSRSERALTVQHARQAKPLTSLPDENALVASLSAILMHKGRARELAVLVAARAVELMHVDHDNWDGGIDYWGLVLGIEAPLFAALSERDRQECEAELEKEAASFFGARDGLRYVTVRPIAVDDASWRERSAAWLRGAGISNQARVRSDNLPTREVDGLLFRSQAEIMLYKALKAKGVAFAPLPVFLRGGAEYRRIEPDFIVVKDGVVMWIEVDGDTVHTESPADAHSRGKLLTAEGVICERVLASALETQEDATHVATTIVAAIEKHRRNR